MQAGVPLPANRRRLSVISGCLNSLGQTSAVFNCLQQSHTLNLMGHSVRLRRFFRMDVLLIASVLSTAYIATALPIASARPIFSSLSRPSVFTGPRALFVQPVLSMPPSTPYSSCSQHASRTWDSCRFQHIQRFQRCQGCRLVSASQRLSPSGLTRDISCGGVIETSQRAAPLCTSSVVTSEASST